MTRPSSYYDAAQMELGTYSPSTSGRHPVNQQPSPYANRGTWDYYASPSYPNGASHNQNQPQQRSLARMPSTDAHLRTNSFSSLPQPSSSSSTSSSRHTTTGGLGRSVSISGYSDMGPPPPPSTSSSNRTMYSPNSSSNSNGDQMMMWSSPHRTSPASVASAPAQSGLMRRGQSYDGAAVGAGRQPLAGASSPLSGHFLSPEASTSSGRPLSYGGPSSSNSKSPPMFSLPFAAPSSSSQSSYSAASPISPSSLYPHHIPSSGSKSRSGSIQMSTAPQQYMSSPTFGPDRSNGSPSSSVSHASLFYAGGDQHLRSSTTATATPSSPSMRSAPSPRLRRNKGLQKVVDPSQIQFIVNAQPPNRRADPQGGFISVRVLFSTRFASRS